MDLMSQKLTTLNHFFIELKYNLASHLKKNISIFLKIKIMNTFFLNLVKRG